MQSGKNLLDPTVSLNPHLLALRIMEEKMAMDWWLREIGPRDKVLEFEF